MEAARKQHQMYLFFTAVPVGLVAIIAGTFIRLPALGPGMVFGGVFTLVEGYLFNWPELSAPLKFVSPAFTAYRRLGGQEQKEEKHA